MDAQPITDKRVHMKAILPSQAHIPYSSDVKNIFEPYVDPIWENFVNNYNNEPIFPNVLGNKVLQTSANQFVPPIQDGVPLSVKGDCSTNSR